MMCPAIDNPASCKIRTVIHFLDTKYKSAAEIHHGLCAVYSQNVMSEWCRMFKDGRTNVHDEKQSGQTAISGE
jgi:hypothetical protein